MADHDLILAVELKTSEFPDLDTPRLELPAEIMVPRDKLQDIPPPGVGRDFGRAIGVGIAAQRAEGLERGHAQGMVRAEGDEPRLAVKTRQLLMRARQETLVRDGRGLRHVRRMKIENFPRSANSSRVTDSLRSPSLWGRLMARSSARPARSAA